MAYEKLHAQSAVNVLQENPIAELTERLTRVRDAVDDSPEGVLKGVYSTINAIIKYKSRGYLNIHPYDLIVADSDKLLDGIKVNAAYYANALRSTLNSEIEKLVDVKNSNDLRTWLLDLADGVVKLQCEILGYKDGGLAMTATKAWAECYDEAVLEDDELIDYDEAALDEDELIDEEDFH